METGDCEPSLDPCETVSCNLQTHLCEYVSLDDCAAALPVVHTFNYCPAMNDYGWAFADLEGKGIWSCGTSGPLGPDGRLRLVPESINGSLESTISTPPLASDLHPSVTIQYDRALELQGGEAHLLLYLVEDGQYTPIRDESFVVDVAGDTVAHVVSGEELAGAGVGFGVAAADAADVVQFDLDNVRVCPGEAPVWDQLPQAIEVVPGMGGEFDLAAHDPEGDELYFILKATPSFASLGPVVCDDWGCTSTIEVWPDAGDVGEYAIRLRMGDGCLWWEATVDLVVE